MGALTLKSFPFELRGWEIEKIESFNLTDGFCSNTWVYLNKTQIIQIEPMLNVYTNNWLNDKGRLFFDAIFQNLTKNKETKKECWFKMFDRLLKTVYIFEHCCRQNSKNYFFIVLFDYLSIELLVLLNFISKNYSFLSLKQSQFYNNNINIDLESSFQLNNLSNKKKLISSTLCLLIATNPRYEGHVLNLNLRQRIFKKNFKCIVVGSLINLTFPVSFLGSNTNIIKNITEGNNFICQNFKESANFFLLCNYELFKRNDVKTIHVIIKTLFYLNIFNKTWSGLNILSSSISDVGVLSFNQKTSFKLKDLNNFSCIYFLNVTASKLANFKKITELQLFKQQLFVKISHNTTEKKLFLDQNYKINNNYAISNKILTDYFYTPINVFYENEETYINAEGFIKRTNKIISKNNNKNNWQILRKFLKYFKNKLICLNKKDNQILFFNFSKLHNFRNFIYFNFYPTKKITFLSCFLNIQNKKFVINTTVQLKFKTKIRKFINTKLKYWLDDFFIGGNDQYSQYSAVLISCSVHEKHTATNFF